jgi:hypothetical protein
LLIESDRCWTEIGAPSDQFFFEGSKNLNEKPEVSKNPKLTRSQTKQRQNPEELKLK